MTRKLTDTYALPEELCEVLAEKAEAEGRSLEVVAAEHFARHQKARQRVSPEESDRRRAAFERHLGEYDSGRDDSADNERIDADLAREYGSCKHEGPSNSD